MPGETTIIRTGQKSVPLCTSGHDKGSITVVIAAIADERKLKPFVVLRKCEPSHAHLWSGGGIEQIQVVKRIAIG